MEPARVDPDLVTNLPKPRNARKPRAAGMSTVGGVAVSDGLPKGYRMIMLQPSNDINPTGQFFGVNGRGYMLKPGVPANVPQGIVDLLENAVYDEPILHPDTQQVIGTQKRLRFSYSILDGKPALAA